MIGAGSLVPQNKRLAFRAETIVKRHCAALNTAYQTAAPDFRGLTLIPDSGHWVQFERPDAFDDALLAALAA